MRILTVVDRSLFFRLGDRIRVHSHKYIVVQFSREVFPEHPEHVRYDLQLDRAENHPYEEPEAQTVDLLDDRRIMSWRTEGDLIDTEGILGTTGAGLSIQMRLTPEGRALLEGLCDVQRMPITRLPPVHPASGHAPRCGLWEGRACSCAGRQV